MASAHEEDVVIAFRQAVEEQMRKAQSGVAPHSDVFAGGAATEEVVRRLAEQQAQLAQEVALLRTIVLRLVSEPVDENAGK